MSEKSLQEQFAPQNLCFGCGPSNKHGLRLRSIVRGDEVAAQWQPQPLHQAFDGILNGGIIGVLLDCHCNWTAAWNLMRQSNADHPPCTVTAEYTIRMTHPTPTQGTVDLRANVVRLGDRK